MGFLDKLLGRGKKAVGDVTGNTSLHEDGVHQEQEAAAQERADHHEELAQDERETAAEHHAEREGA